MLKGGITKTTVEFRRAVRYQRLAESRQPGLKNFNLIFFRATQPATRKGLAYFRSQARVKMCPKTAGGPAIRRAIPRSARRTPAVEWGTA